MSHPDERLGANLAALRGGRSQAALAAEMKARGWKWSQPTVAAIEKGERSLKLAEALDLLTVLNLHDLEALTARPRAAVAENALRRVQAAEAQLIANLVVYLEAKEALEPIAHDFADADEELPEGDEVWRDWIERDPVDVAATAAQESGYARVRRFNLRRRGDRRGTTSDPAE